MPTITLQGEGLCLIFTEISETLAVEITSKRIDEAVFEQLTSAEYYDSGLVGDFTLVIDQQPVDVTAIGFDADRAKQTIPLGVQGKCYFVGEIRESGDWFSYESPTSFDATKLYPETIAYALGDGSGITLTKVFYGGLASEIATVEQTKNYYVLMADGTRREIRLTDV